MELTRDDGGPLRWFCAPSHFPTILGPDGEPTPLPGYVKQFPDGVYNLGFAHGPPGILAALCRPDAARATGTADQEARSHRVRQGVRELSRTLEALRIDSLDHPAWANLLLPHPDTGRPDTGAEQIPARSAWCYGPPGVAASLLPASAVCGEPEPTDLAVATLLGLERTPAEQQRINSPTLCHGLAGLVTVYGRAAAQTGLPELRRMHDAFLSRMCSYADPHHPYLFPDYDPWGGHEHNPGLLTGAAGVLLALLGAVSDTAAGWDELLFLTPGPGPARAAGRERGRARTGPRHGGDVTEERADTYRACGFFMLRAPALPARPMLELLGSLPAAAGEAARSDAGRDDPDSHDAYANQLRKLWSTPGVPEAVRAASPHLADAVERFDGLGGKDRRKAVRGLGRYLNRMSFRATPFRPLRGRHHRRVRRGAAHPARRHRHRSGPRTRADSGWVMHLVKRLAFGAQPPAELRVRRNDLVHVSRGRVWLSTAEGYGLDAGAEPARTGAPGDGGRSAPRGRRSVSVRLTAPIRSVLDHTRTPMTLGDLTARLAEDFPTAGAERIATLLDGLLDSDILITAERPRLLVPPAGRPDRGASLLRSMLPPVTDPAVAGAIDGLEAAIGAFNQGEIPVAELLEAASRPMPEAVGGHSGPTLQIDSTLNLDAPLVPPRAVAGLAEEAARVFRRVGAEDRYPPHLSEYADAFSERYGHRSEIPLLEALTPETGLGPPRRYRSPGQAYPLPGVVRRAEDGARGPAGRAAPGRPC
ncbi:lantibiotic dehydratase [Streptomyces sp. GKU 257-1]|nr:lantibiotic dehydratase [Streptomyces sp. GKU 257-1]